MHKVVDRQMALRILYHQEINLVHLVLIVLKRFQIGSHFPQVAVDDIMSLGLFPSSILLITHLKTESFCTLHRITQLKMF